MFKKIFNLSFFSKRDRRCQCVCVVVVLFMIVKDSDGQWTVSLLQNLIHNLWMSLFASVLWLTALSWVWRSGRALDGRGVFFVNVLTNVFHAEVKSDTFKFVFYFSWPMSWSRSFLLLWCHHVAVLYDTPWISEGSLMQKCPRVKDATWTCLRTPRLSTRPHLHLF